MVEDTSYTRVVDEFDSLTPYLKTHMGNPGGALKLKAKPIEYVL